MEGEKNDKNKKKKLVNEFINEKGVWRFPACSINYYDNNSAYPLFPVQG